MDAELADLLRADLVAAGYTVDRLRQLWGDEADAALARGDRVPARRALDATDAGVGQVPTAAAGQVATAAAGRNFESAAPAAGRNAHHPAGTLARLFLLGQSVADEQLTSALPTLGAAGARTLGLLDSGGRALIDVRPYSAVDEGGAVQWFIASDLGEDALGEEAVGETAVGEEARGSEAAGAEALVGALPAHHVLGVGGASLTLATLIPTEPVDRVLDLGTGCGIQSLHAARHARSVVATDISARAIKRASLTFALNGVSSVELRQGDLFAPVAGELFDRIVSNPPFVITPRREGVPLYEYRDGGLVGDAIVERVVRGAAEHLRPGGTAHLLGNWEYRDVASSDEHSGDGLERVRRWITEAGLDGWVVERERQSPAEYAATWIRDGGTRVGTPDYDWLATAWLDDFQSRGVAAVGFGYIFLRRPVTDGAAAGASAAADASVAVSTAPGTSTPAASRLVRTEVLTAPLGAAPTGIGDHLLACLRAHDGVSKLDDAQLGAVRLEVAPDVTEERHYWPGDANPTVIRLQQGGGFARTIDADAALAGLVGASDGELTVAEIIGALATLLEVDEFALRDQLLPQVRELLVTGLLTASLLTASRLTAGSPAS